MSIEGSRYTAGQFHEGELLSAEKLNQLGLAADRGHTYHSSGFYTTQGPFGTLFSQESVIPSEPIYDYPFKTYVIPDQAPNTFKIYVRAGLLNNFVPKLKGADGGDKVMDADPVPYFKVAITSSKTQYIMLRAKRNPSSFFANDPEVFLSENYLDHPDTSDEGYMVLASVNFTKPATGSASVSQLYQYIYTSQMVIRAYGGPALPAFWSFTSR